MISHLVKTPFSQVSTKKFVVGTSVKEMADAIFGDFDGFWQALIKLPEGSKSQWEVIPKGLLKSIKPKTSDCIKFEYIPAGGDSGRGILGIILAVAVTAIAGPLAGALLGAGASSTAVAFATAAITIGGNLALQQLFKTEQPRQIATPEDAKSAFENIESDNNPLGKDQPIPRVVGERRVTPAELAFPHQYIENGKDTVDRVFGFGGRHDITDVKLGNVSVDDLDGVQIDITDGQGSSRSQNIVKTISATKNIGFTLSGFATEAETEALVNQAEPEKSEPSTITYAPGFSENLIEYVFRATLNPQYLQSSNTDNVRLPLRIQLRKKGNTDWKNLPEIHIVGRTTNPKPVEIKFRFDNDFPPVSSANELSYNFFQQVPAANAILSNEQTGMQWQSHSSFVRGSGILDVQNIFTNNDSINVFLNPSEFEMAEYEFQFLQGIVIDDSAFRSNSYQLNNNVESLFFSKLGESNNWFAPVSTDGVFGGMNIDWMTYTVNRQPVEMPQVAQIGMKVTDVDARNVTCVAAGYTRIWDGTNWNTFGKSRNPADWYYNTLYEWLTFYGCSVSILDLQEIQDWHAECVARGYEVGFVQAGQTMIETLQLIATAGFASPRFGYDIGVDYYRDRSDELAAVSFSHRDSEIGITWTSSEVPKGARVSFDNEEKEYQRDEFYINDPYGSTSFIGNEVFEYGSITKPSNVKRRANYDLLKTAELRRIWTISTGQAGFFRKRGDLVNVVTDLFDDFSHAFYIREVMDSSAVAVDSVIPADSSDDLLAVTDLLSEPSLLELGANSIVSIITPSGAQEYNVQSVSDNIIRFDTDLLDTNIKGARMQIVSRRTLFNRAVVLDVTRQSDQQAVLTCVDEAPQIFDELQRLDK